MLFQPSRKSFGVLLTAFPDTLRAFRLLRIWQRRALLRCVSDQVCWKSKRLRRIRSLRLCEGNRHIVGGKGQHRRGENSDNGGDHADQQQCLCREVDAVHCAHPAGPTAKVTAPSGPTLALQQLRQLGDIRRDPPRLVLRVAAMPNIMVPLETPHCFNRLLKRPHETLSATNRASRIG